MHGNGGVVVAECSGREPLGTHVNEEMAAFVEEEADRLDVSKSDFLRLLLVAYRGRAQVSANPTTKRCQRER